MSKVEKKQKKRASFSKNLYCCCVDYVDNGDKCNLCKLLERGIDYRVPNKHSVKKYKVVVTGTNGKTTMTNILGKLLSKVEGGKKIGYASSTGIYINNKKVNELEQRASEHYVYLLNQPKLKVVVSEQPEAGIYMYGLPINHDIGIVTNITEDHLNRHWIKNGMWDVYKLKSLVVKMAVEGVITSGDYPWTRKLIKEFDNKQYYLYSSSYKNAKRYIEQGYPVTYVRDGKITIDDRGKKILCGSIEDYGLTIKGILDYNILNVLTVITFLYHSNFTKSKFEKYKEELKRLSPSFDINPARFNLMKYRDTVVVLDYAHNLDGYIKSISALGKLKNMIGAKRVGVVATLLPGKTYSAIDKIAGVLKDGSDKVFVKQYKDNSTVKMLHNKISSRGGNSIIWEKSFEDLLKEKNSKFDLIYMTLGAAEPHKEFENLVDNLNLKDYIID